MTQEASSDGTSSKGMRKTTKRLLAFVLVAASSYAVYSIMGDKGNAPEAQTHKTVDISKVKAAPDGISKALSKGAMTAFVSHTKRKDVPNLSFKDGKGNDLDLAKWKGRVVLLNLWATWCGPCRKEMPDLADLQKQLGSENFEVVALSVDRKGIKASGRFLVEAKATALNLYVDKTSKSLGKIHAIGLPLTVLIDRNGKEIGRLTGPAVWNGTEAVRLIKTALAEK